MFKTTALDSVANEYVDEVGVTPGTRLEADDRNIIQDELVNAVEGAGLTLDAGGTNRDQLLEAMSILGLTSKNVLINGDFRIAQRGSDGAAVFDAGTTPANDDDTYLLDRWLLLSDGDDIVDVSQSTEVPTGALLSCALDVETVNKKFGILQVIEQKNCAHMIDGNVSLSFEAKVSDITKLDNIKAMIVAWDGTADAVTSDIISAWNAEDTAPALVANWTIENTPANLGVTAAWAKYTIENIAIDTSGAKNIGVFIWSDGFSDTAAKFLYITNVQLEENSAASEYEWRDVGKELILCQRYYYKTYDTNVLPGTVDNDGRIYFGFSDVNNSVHDYYSSPRFPVTMRAKPTVTSYDAAGASGKVTMAVNNGIAPTIETIGFDGVGRLFGSEAASTSRILTYHLTAEAEL